MRVTIYILISAFVITSFFPANASMPVQESPEPIATTTAEIAKKYNGPYFNNNNGDLKSELWVIAKSKGLSDDKIKEIEVVIGGGDPNNKKCPNGESGWFTHAIGDNGTSFGIVQIHLPAHPEITKEQAMDSQFAFNFIVDEFLRGNEWKWTCWKAYFAVTPPPSQLQGSLSPEGEA
jgi:hypothetical protein